MEKTVPFIQSIFPSSTSADTMDQILSNKQIQTTNQREKWGIGVMNQEN